MLSCYTRALLTRTAWITGHWSVNIFLSLTINFFPPSGTPTKGKKIIIIFLQRNAQFIDVLKPFSRCPFSHCHFSCFQCPLIFAEVVKIYAVCVSRIRVIYFCIVFTYLLLRDEQVLRSDIERHGVEMKSVDHTGTYLKYFGSKQDTVYVRNRLSSTRLRWKRLLRRVDETSRRLDRALRDAKRVKIHLIMHRFNSYFPSNSVLAS